MIETVYRLGSENFPIRLLPQISEKKEVNNQNESTRWPRKNLTLDYLNKEINSIYDEPQDFGCYVENIFSNPYLNHIEIKIALYLHKQLFAFDGEIFFINSRYTSTSLGKTVGEDGAINFSDSSILPVSIDEIKNLREELQNFNIIVSNQALSEAIQRLHDFAYITVTEICWSNVLERAVRKDIKLSDSQKSTIYAHHIRIFTMMDERNLTKRWKEKIECVE